MTAIDVKDNGNEPWDVVGGNSNIQMKLLSQKITGRTIRSLSERMNYHG